MPPKSKAKKSSGTAKPVIPKRRPAPLDTLVLGYKHTQDTIPKGTDFMSPFNHSLSQQPQLTAPPSGGSLHTRLMAGSTHNSHGNCQHTSNIVAKVLTSAPLPKTSQWSWVPNTWMTSPPPSPRMSQALPLTYREVYTDLQHNLNWALPIPYQLKCWARTLTGCGHSSQPHCTPTTQGRPFHVTLEIPEFPCYLT